jgi:hypothetical protein
VKRDGQKVGPVAHREPKGHEKVIKGGEKVIKDGEKGFLPGVT